MKRWRDSHFQPVLAVILTGALITPAVASRRIGTTGTGSRPGATDPGARTSPTNDNSNAANLSAPALIDGALTTLSPISIPEGNDRQADAAPETIALPTSEIAPQTFHNAKRVHDNTPGPIGSKAAENKDVQLMSEGAQGGDKTPKAGPEAQLSHDAVKVFATIASMKELFDGGSARTINRADPKPDRRIGRHHTGFHKGMKLNEADLRGGTIHVRQWRLGDDAFKAQPSVEELVADLDLSDEHAQWLTNAIFTDRLTGLRNAIFLRENQEELVTGNDNLITMKLDWLKEINDGVSHAAGDRFLQAFGIIAGLILGDEATLIRRSPTGFAAFVEGGPEKARLIAQALRLGIEEQLGSEDQSLVATREAKTPVTTTISAGLTQLALDNLAISDTIGQIAEDSLETDKVLKANMKELARSAANQVYNQTYERAEEARMQAKDDAGGNTVAIHDGEVVRFDEEPTMLELREAFEENDIQVWPAEAIDISYINFEPESDPVGDAIPGETMRDKVMHIAPKEQRHASINALMRKIYNNHLSGLHNRRWLDDNLEDVLGFFTEIHAIDIDFFGDVNKRIGEEEADRALGVLGRILHEQTRGKPGIALHLSGEEFFIFTRMGPHRASQFAQRVRQHVADNLGRRTNLRDRETGAQVNPTISIGIAPIAHDNQLANAELRNKILEESEEALKQSKQMGRNWVSIFGSAPSWLDHAIGSLHSVEERISGLPLIGAPSAKGVNLLAKGLRRWARH